MMYETNDFISPNDSELNRDIEKNPEIERTQEGRDYSADTHESISPSSATLIAYTAYKASEIPAIKEKINDCKETISEKFSDAKETVEEFIGNIGKNIKEFTAGVYESVKDYFDETKNADTQDIPLYSREFSETREFGIASCVEAAKEFFNEGVINEWANLSYNERAQICYLYADKVAESFELENYKGVIFEQMEPGTLGSNCGDGYIHLTMDLLNPINTPLNLIDTITHELRHQYQSECVEGYHDIADEVRNEWSLATEIYTTDAAWCYDPWGYMYNPLEIDSRYAGETVVRELTSQIFNDAIAKA